MGFILQYPMRSLAFSASRGIIPTRCMTPAAAASRAQLASLNSRLFNPFLQQSPLQDPASRAALSNMGVVGASRGLCMSGGLSPDAPAQLLVLTYSYVPDILERRGPHRAGHLAGAQELTDSGNCIMAGALANPVDGAIFVFRGLTEQQVAAFVQKDPYVINGLVTEWKIREWTAVVGTGSL
eukprot:CAMPEP_0181296870 /NCGR_PEP_ID=MMETSP1101-20121128/4933_1 /TAXON_ID=46948 /ORGANISM="Rhodomonas abbreviata, Strain Caron Lab Isolate" /LENGTH=181 /DNA_ID=CAMNT_0023401761 /DNA_START=96 /DNA_END=641 /DNA_ORIENTATION=+